MFDDQVPPQNTQQEPQDIFSETSPQHTVAQYTTNTPISAQQPTQDFSHEEQHSSFNPKLIVIIVAILAVLVVAAFGIQFALRNQQKPSSQTQVPVTPVIQTPPLIPSTSVVPPPAPQPEQSAVIVPPDAVKPEIIPPAPQTLDSDSDGLTDDEELKLGTDPQKNDSDGDTLSDGDEVKTYHTNPLLNDSDTDGLDDNTELQTYKSDPLNADTDGDGYLDGAEVKSGYDPAGPGKLTP